MTKTSQPDQGDPTDRLSAKRQFVLVVRVGVEAGGKVTGELVDPLSKQQRRFTGLANLVEAVGVWIGEALASTLDDQQE